MKVELVGGKFDGEVATVPDNMTEWSIHEAVYPRIAGIKTYREVVYRLGTTRSHHGLPQFWLVPPPRVDA